MNDILNQTNTKIDAAIVVLKNKLSAIVATGAHPSLLNNITVSYYEVQTPLAQLANIKAMDSTMLMIAPYDKAIVKEIVAAINKSNMGLNPVDEGETIRIMVPPLTSDKRDLFVKDAKKLGEEGRISIRNVRQDSNKKIRLNKDASENEQELFEGKIQEVVDKGNKSIEEIINNKIKELQSV